MQWVYVVLVLIALWADGQWYFSPTYRKGDSRAVAAWLVAHRDTVKSWTVLPGYLSRSVEWYLQPQPDILARSCPAREDRTTSFPPVPDILILGRRHHLQAPDQIVADYRAQAGNVRALDSIAGFELYVRSAASSRTAAGTIFVCSRLP